MTHPLALAVAATVAAGALLGPITRPDDGESAARLADQEALQPFASVVGDWKGTGQPRRGSARGAWRESASWAWSLTRESAALELRVADGMFLRSARLRPDRDHPGRFRLDATLADGSPRTFSGVADGRNRLRLDAEGEGDGLRRITLTPLHESRLLLLFEGVAPGGTTIGRLAEVGYTREGVAFAVGSSAPECIVTGGRGTIPVGFGGKTYFVCCSGCKELFDDDPAAIVSEYERGRRERGPAR